MPVSVVVAVTVVGVSLFLPEYQPDSEVAFFTHIKKGPIYEKQKHFDRTLYWVLKLKPDADEAFQIAAYSHDIRRAFDRERANNAVGKSKKGFQDHHYQSGGKTRD